MSRPRIELRTFCVLDRCDNQLRHRPDIQHCTVALLTRAQDTNWIPGEGQIWKRGRLTFDGTLAAHYDVDESKCRGRHKKWLPSV